MRFSILMTLGLTLAAPLLASASVHQANTVATYLGGGNQSAFSDGENQATSGDGYRVVFEDTGDFAGKNADGSNEIFIWDRETGYTQITDNPAQAEGRVSALAIDREGDTVAMAGNMDPAASGATTGELYRWTRTGGWQRLTFTSTVAPDIHTPGLALSDDGRRLVFNSRGDYTGENPDNEYRVFAWTQGSGMMQVNLPDECPAIAGRVLDISGSGSRVLFQSPCRYGSFNPQLKRQLLIWDENRGLMPLTNSSEGVFATGSLSASGLVAAFVGTNVKAGVEAGRRLYRWTATGGMQQLNKYETSSVQPSISDDGNRIAYVARNGQGGPLNQDGNREVFLWEGGKTPVISAITDNPDGDSTFGSTRPSLAGAGDRLSLTARRAFGGKSDLRRGVFSVEIVSPSRELPNLLVAGTFDNGLRGWDPQPGASHSTDDVRQQPTSGSARVSHQGQVRSPRIAPLTQCVGVAPYTEYALTALTRHLTTHSAGSTNLDVTLYPGRGCQGQGLEVAGGISHANSDGFWRGSSLRFRTLDNTVTAKVTLSASRTANSGAVEAGFDDVELRPLH